MANKTNGKAASQSITSLLQLPGRDFTVKLEITGQEETIEMPCRALTFRRYQEIGRMVPDAQPPSMAGKTGVMYDFQNPDYRAKQEVVQEKRNMLRLAEFIQAEIPGETLEAKAEWIAENVEMGILNALKSQMDRTIQGGGAAVEARAASFQPV